MGGRMTQNDAKSLEKWVLTVTLPPGLPAPGRFMARVLKHLLRTWRVRCVALRESEELERLRQENEKLRQKLQGCLHRPD